MLRFTWVRGISAVLLAGFMPIILFFSLPITIGFLALASIEDVQLGGQFTRFLAFQVILFGAALLLYPLSCAMIYGMWKRWRVLAFSMTISGTITLLFLLGHRLV